MYDQIGSNCLQLPYLGYGLGLRHPHIPYILQHRPRDVEWFEVISEDYMDSHSGHWEMLADLQRDYPIVLHGVSMSLGSTDALNIDYLERLKKLIDAVQPAWVSDHVCWTGIHGIHMHDLLPVPYTEEALKHFCSRVRQVQDFLERPLLLENPSSYLSFSASTMPEWEFVSRLAEDSNSGILLDVNNVYVSAFNHQFDACEYIDALPQDRVIQIHLAGHDHQGTHIMDTHDNCVTHDVWELYAYTLARIGKRTTMVEWDKDIPAFSVLQEELQKARYYG
jgi:uncharacterized protein (UPF0276 family)